MFPPAQGLNLDIEAISGICGSISIAFWVIVYSPQVIENFRRGSADGLSMQFVIVWLLGDVFNILGAILQGVLPTMIILAVYYTLADAVLLGQCLYYDGLSRRDEDILNSKPTANGPSERTPLLNSNEGLATNLARPSGRSNTGTTYPSQVTSFLDTTKLAGVPASQKSVTRFQAMLANIFSILMVCIAGVFGWWMSNFPERSRDLERPPHRSNHGLSFNLLGQVFGYLCAFLYLGSRAPQILLNYRRKSTEGLSMLFFVFACMGNLTYVLSILAFEPQCQAPHNKCEAGEARQIYGRYMLLNASWLLGSLGSILLDLVIFVQFWLYQKDDDVPNEDDTLNQGNNAGDRSYSDEYRSRPNGRAIYSDRPLLQREDSVY